MELLIVQLLIVAFLIAYLMGEEAKVNQYPQLIITREVDTTPYYVWEVYWEKAAQDYDALLADMRSSVWKLNITEGLSWSAEVGPTPA